MGSKRDGAKSASRKSAKLNGAIQKTEITSEISTSPGCVGASSAPAANVRETPKMLKQTAAARQKYRASPFDRRAAWIHAATESRFNARSTTLIHSGPDPRPPIVNTTKVLIRQSTPTTG